MLRIIHTADVHLGARHDDLGEQAAAQRERQFAAFKAAVDLALTEKVDLFLIAGDLFDSNVQPRRSVERVAAELKPASPRRGSGPSSSRAPTTSTTAPRSIAPTTSPPWPATQPRTTSMVTVLDPDHPSVHLAALETIVHGRVFADQARPAQPAPGRRRRRGRRTGRGRARDLARRDGPRLDRDPGQDRPRRGRHHDRRDRRQRARLPRPRPLALGPERQGRHGRVRLLRRARGGRPRPGPGGQGPPGRARRDAPASGRSRSTSDRSAGPRFAKLEIDAATVASQPALVDLLAARADPDLVLDARLVGVRPRRARPRPRRDRGRPRAVLPQGPRPRWVAAGADRGAAAVARHDRRRVHPRPRGAHRRARGGRLRRPRRPSSATRSGSAGCCSAGHEVSL